MESLISDSDGILFMKIEKDNFIHFSVKWKLKFYDSNFVTK